MRPADLETTTPTRTTEGGSPDPIVVLFSIFQTGAGANGGVESISHLIQNLPQVRRLVLTQKETPMTSRWRRSGEVTVRPVGYEIGSAMPWRRPLRMARRLWDLVSFNWRTFRLIRSRGVDVLHANDVDALLHCGFGAKAAGRPVVFNVRDINEPEKAYGIKWGLARIMSRKIVVLSSEMADELRARLPAWGRDGTDIDFIYSIVDLDQMQPLDAGARGEARSALGMDPREFAIGYIANVTPKKGQLDFLRHAAREILEKIPHARLHFLGDCDPAANSYAFQCREAARVLDPRGERIVFHGYTAEMDRWYPAMDLVALASRREGLARCMIESLACGVPVVSFAVCSASEILTPTGAGRVVDQGDYDAFVSQVVDLAGDELQREESGRAGTELARRLFRADVSSAAYRSLYERVRHRGQGRLSSSVRP